MDQTLKNRLVGAAVLLALAFILLPLLFDGANQQALMSDLRMPAPPATPDAAALLDGGRSALAEAKEEVMREHASVEPEPEPVPPVAVAPSPSEPVPSAAPAPATPAPAATAAVADERLSRLAEAWDVQVAAGSSVEGAERLRAALAAAGYKARVRQDAAVYRVVVGPVLRREDAVALRAALAADARVGKPAGMLVRYIP